MACYIVTYDLNKETNRPDIVAAFDAYDGWARLSESSYSISTNKSPDQVFSDFAEYLDGNDQIYVISLSKPYAGQGDQKVNDWLEGHLPG